MQHRKPEQVNTSVPAENAVPEYDLEDILKEFGSEASAPKTVTVQLPSRPPQEEKAESAKNAEKAKTAKKTPAPRSVWPPEEPEKPTPKKRPPRVEVTEQAPPAPTPQALREQYAGTLGGSSLRFGISLLCFLAQFALVLLLEFAPNTLTFLSTRTLSVLSAALLALSLLLVYDVPLHGLRDLFRLRPSLFTLGTLAACLCIADALVSGVSYGAPATLLLCCLERALLLRGRAMHRTLSAVCGFEHPMGVCRIVGLSESALRCDTGDTAAFCAELEQPDASQTLFGIYSLIFLPATLIAAALLAYSGRAGFLHGWTLLLLGAAPCAGMLSYCKPFFTLSKRLSDIRGALCGWAGAGILSGKHTILLRDGDLFPVSGISSNGMKLYAAHPAAKVIGYALATLQAADSPLVPLFEGLLESQYGKHYQAASHRFYDTGGIGAEVASDIVLVGSLPFIQSMGVHMPSGTKVRLAVYVSINGELAGVFALKYKPSRSTRVGLRAVLSKSKLNLVLATRDFLITPSLIAAKYDVPTQRLVFPSYADRQRLASSELSSASWQGALVAKDTFGAFAATVVAGQNLHAAALCLIVLNLLAGLLGVILCALLLFWSASDAASPFHIALFQLLWVILSSFISFILTHF